MILIVIGTKYPFAGSHPSVDITRQSENVFAETADSINFAAGLTRRQVDAFIEKVIINDEEHIEIIFKFDDLFKRIITETEEADAS